MGAKSGMTQMLIDMLGIDPAEIQNQALQFKAVADSINNRLGEIQKQNAAIMRHLKIGETDDARIEAADPGTAS